MSSMSVCDACTRRKRTSVATEFCTDCEDHLCPDCVSVHSTFRAFMSHHLVTTELADNQSFHENKYCTNHNGLILDFYCLTHDNLCCKSCIGHAHRSCGKIIPIDVASKGVKSSAMFEDLTGEVLHMMAFVSSLFKERDTLRSNLTKSKTNALQKADNMKRELHRRVDNLYEKSVGDINSLYLQLLEQTEATEQEINEQTQSICDHSSKMEFMSKYGSDSQIFRLLNCVKADMIQIKVNLEKFLKSFEVPSVEFKENDFFPLTKSLGIVKRKRHQCSVQLKPLKRKQAQTIHEHDEIGEGIQLERIATLPERTNISITSLCMTPDNHIMMCNNSPHDSELLVLTDKGQYVNNITLPYRPYGIALDPYTDDAWVTLPEGLLIQVVDTLTLLPVRPVHTPESCYGIAFIKNDIAVGGYGKIYIINKKGITLSSFDVGKRELISVFWKNNKIFCCDGKSHIIYHIDIGRGNVFSYTSPRMGKPVGVAVDAEENVYGVCSDTNTLHQFAQNGKHKNVLLTNCDGIKAPLSMTFNNDCTKMYIPNDSTNSVMIFSCSL